MLVGSFVLFDKIKIYNKEFPPTQWSAGDRVYVVSDFIKNEVELYKQLS